MLVLETSKYTHKHIHSCKKSMRSLLCLQSQFAARLIMESEESIFEIEPFQIKVFKL